MATLVSDLADVSRIEAGRLRLEFKAFGIKDIVDEVVRSMRRQVEEKNQSAVYRIFRTAQDLGGSHAHSSDHHKPG
jgi:signal transduction histidine kinase